MSSIGVAFRGASPQTIGDTRGEETHSAGQCLDRAQLSWRPLRRGCYEASNKLAGERL